MKTSKVMIALALVCATVAGGIGAQKILIDRDQEKKEFPELQQSEKKQEENIFATYKQYNEFGPLVELARQDRMIAFEQAKDPLNFKYTFRNVKFTPRNTYIRYVRENKGLIYLGLGEVDKVDQLIQEKLKEAADNKINVPAPQIAAQDGRHGIELTQFEFIYDYHNKVKKTVGSRRKSIMLFYKQTNTQADTKQNLALDLVVTRVINDDASSGVKNVEVIIDPTPLDQQMEDLIVIHRYNFKVPVVTPVALMANTSSYPSRLRFKQKFYIKLVDQFGRLYAMVLDYSAKDDNKYNEELNDLLIKSMEY